MKENSGFLYNIFLIFISYVGERKSGVDKICFLGLFIFKKGNIVGSHNSFNIIL